MSGTFVNVGSMARYGQRNGSMSRATRGLNPLARATLRLRFNRGEVDPRILCGRTTTGTYFDSAGVLQTAAIDVPRLTYDPANLLAAPGLLAEAARTNSIRNSTMQGAVAGTPGTVPTNWSVSSDGNGVSRQVVGIGTEDGIPYVDIRYSGTPTASAAALISFEAANSVPATSGQTWAFSAFVKLASGSFSGTSTILSLLGTNGTTGVQAFTDIPIANVSSRLSACRFSGSGAMSSATVTHAQHRVRIGYTIGVPIDITLRIGLPQLELGASASSPIPTSGTAVTRSADNLSMTDMSWYSSAGGVLYCDAEKLTTAGTTIVFQIDDLTTSNRVLVGVLATGQNGTVAGVFVGAQPQATWNPIGLTNVSKTAFRFAANNFLSAYNGVLSSLDTSGSLPTVSSVAIGQNRSASFNGLIREIAFIPNTSISDGALQRLTR